MQLSLSSDALGSTGVAMDRNDVEEGRESRI